MDMSSIALTNLLASSHGWVVVDVEPVTDVDAVAAGSVVASGAVGANEAAKVDGTVVVIVGMAVEMAVSRLDYFNYIGLSNSFSISFD